MGELPIHLAARGGEVSVLQKHVDCGAYLEELDILGDTALLKAVRYGNLDAAKVLIAGGAKITARDASGCSCLHLAAVGSTGSHAKLFLLLLDAGVAMGTLDVGLQTELGDTPLHFAAHFERVKAVKALLQRGADPEAQNGAGETPWDVTSSEAVKALLRPPEFVPAAIEEAETKDNLIVVDDVEEL